MPLPSVEQYSRVIERRDPTTLSTLFDHEFKYLDNGSGKEYCFNIGTSAAVFKAIKDGKTYAVRCFLRGELETFKRYEQLSAFLVAKNPSWRVNFEFLDNEILIDGHYYPLVKMDWDEGTPLHRFIDKYMADSRELSLLQLKLVDLSSELEKEGVGHGDLKYNNILIHQGETDINLKLIDYDSMFIPAFRGRKNLETGSPGFQPLKRLSNHFFESIDRFSIWVMLTTLEAVKADQGIWQNIEQGGFNNEHSLFTASDFFNPRSSKTIQKLKGFKNEDLQFYLDKLVHFSQYSDLNSIEKPRLYKDVSGIPVSHQKWAVPKTPIPEHIPEHEDLWIRFEFEIKTIPSGKDVMVHDIKKGITPLRLSLLKKNFDYVTIYNGSQKTIVPIREEKKVYEFDFTVKEPNVPSPIVEQDEILEFKADRYSVREGELATINWRVKGNSRIHISNMGDVAEKTGTKKVVLKNTTDYVLTIGSKNRSLTINVQPEPQRIVPQVPSVDKEIKKINQSNVTSEPKSRSNKSFQWKAGALVFVMVLASSFFVLNYISSHNNKSQVASSTRPPITRQVLSVSKPVLFTKDKVTSFLENLYASYNSRNIESIMSFYAPTMNEYYSSSQLNNDSLQVLINDLFITPASYKCSPDFSSLTIEPGDNTCKVTITINEKLKKKRRSRTENYNTTIMYTLDSSYKILAEKTAD
jgi:hypothetical protein